jgi:hypothetical protein
MDSTLRRGFTKAGGFSIAPRQKHPLFDHLVGALGNEAVAFVRFTSASALRQRISNSICAPASAVIPAESKGGETSTTSPPTMSRPRSPCNRLGFIGRKSSHGRRARARRESRIESVDVEGDIGWSTADDFTDYRNDPRDAEIMEAVDVDDRHSSLIRKRLFKFDVGIADTDVHGAFGVQHTRFDAVRERGSMMQRRADMLSAVSRWASM